MTTWLFTINVREVHTNWTIKAPDVHHAWADFMRIRGIERVLPSITEIKITRLP